MAAKQVREWRIRLGLTQQRFGDFLWPKEKGAHYLQGRIAKWENNWSDMSFSMYVFVRDKCERVLNARTK